MARRTVNCAVSWRVLDIIGCIDGARERRDRKRLQKNTKLAVSGPGFGKMPLSVSIFEAINLAISGRAVGDMTRACLTSRTIRMLKEVGSSTGESVFLMSEIF
jgi:hypothetical protein